MSEAAPTAPAAPAPIAVVATGLVSAVGLSAPDCCTAARAGITNPSRLRITDVAGEALRGHRLPAQSKAPEARLPRLAFAAAMAIDECMAALDLDARQAIPLLLCIAETDRPGHAAGWDAALPTAIEAVLRQRFAAGSTTLAFGRVGVAVALDHARKLLAAKLCTQVVIAGVDSLLEATALTAYEADGRLLTSRDHDGFLPGEAAAALLVRLAGNPMHAATPSGTTAAPLVCRGIGFGIEPASVNSGEALRGDGLSAALRMALQEAGCDWGDIALRVSDASGEQYFFKEAALACARVHAPGEREMAVRHPALSIGECGAASGVAAIVLAIDAVREEVDPDAAVLVHLSADATQRAALIFGRSTALT